MARGFNVLRWRRLLEFRVNHNTSLGKVFSVDLVAVTAFYVKPHNAGI